MNFQSDGTTITAYLIVGLSFAMCCISCGLRQGTNCNYQIYIKDNVNLNYYHFYTLIGIIDKKSKLFYVYEGAVDKRIKSEQQRYLRKNLVYHQILVLKSSDIMHGSSNINNCIEIVFGGTKRTRIDVEDDDRDCIKNRWKKYQDTYSEHFKLIIKYNDIDSNEQQEMILNRYSVTKTEAIKFKDWLHEQLANGF